MRLFKRGTSGNPGLRSMKHGRVVFFGVAKRPAMVIFGRIRIHGPAFFKIKPFASFSDRLTCRQTYFFLVDYTNNDRHLGGRRCCNLGKRL